MILAEILRQPTKFDCLKHPTIIELESLEYSPFHLIAAVIFALAILHTLFAYKIHHLATKLHPETKEERSFGIQILFFLSEVEIVFALWAIPLFFCIAFMYGWTMGFEYMNTRDYTEALFVVVIFALASTKPIVYVAELLISKIANLFGGSLGAWWLVLLTFGSLLGSLITEAAAMALCALLLSHQFYEYRPSKKLAYATLALLFVNISVGGVLTDFASPAVLILSHCWEWSMTDMFLKFGWKAALGIVLSNLLYWVHFRQELQMLNLRKKASEAFSQQVLGTLKSEIPVWVIAIHVFFMAWIVMVSHYPAIFIAAFLLFVGFHQATRSHQHSIQLTRPLLIGLFLSGLVIHGGLQGWWVVPLLAGLSPLSVMGVAIALTGFNDNAGISYLSTLIPNWGDAFKYAAFIGVVAGGGLTVIANAPNPAGYAILKKHFPQGINPCYLLLAALIPTIILYCIFFFFGPLFHLG